MEPDTHGGKTLHQPLELAHAAGTRLLDLLGFGNVERSGETVTSATPDATPGYILTRFADKYGRPVSLAYAGAADHPDLSQLLPMSNCSGPASTTGCWPRGWSIRPSIASFTPICEPA